MHGAGIKNSRSAATCSLESSAAMESPGTDRETHCALLKFTASTDFFVMPSFNHCGSELPVSCSVKNTPTS